MSIEQVEQTSRALLEKLCDGFEMRDIQRGRYAEVGPNDYYNDGADAMSAYLIEHLAGWVSPEQAGALRAEALLDAAQHNDAGWVLPEWVQKFLRERAEGERMMAALAGVRTPETRWMDGWLGAVEWLEEYGGPEGARLAGEMRTRIPEGPADGTPASV